MEKKAKVFIFFTTDTAVWNTTGTYPTATTGDITHYINTREEKELRICIFQ